MLVLEFEFPENEPEKKKPREGYIPPKTSLDAHDSIKEMKLEHFKKITEALEKLKVGGIYTEIADFCALDPIQVGRRLGEMERAGIIYSVGIKRKTPSGRDAMVKQLVGLKK